MFAKEYILRFGDIDRFGKVKISTILDFLQDISIAHSDSVGYSAEKLKEMNIAWLLQGWRLKIQSIPSRKLPVVVKTAIMDCNKYESVRKYEIYQEEKLVALATSQWFTVDTENLKLTKVPDEVKNAFETEESNGLPLVKLRNFEGLLPAGEFCVQLRDLDTNNHLNNVKSAEILLDYIGCDGDIDEIFITYKRQVYGGDVVKIQAKCDGNNAFAQICNDDKQPCVMMKVNKA